MSKLKRPPTLKMAPPVSHVVKRHARISSNGIKYYVKAHIRKNRGREEILLPENLNPFFIKVLIAKESSFRVSIKTKIAGSSATGLM